MDENNPFTDIPLAPETPYEEYFRLAGGLIEACHFETHCLSQAREFLPACAIAVLNKEPAADEYWSWLAQQWKESV